MYTKKLNKIIANLDYNKAIENKFDIKMYNIENKIDAYESRLSSRIEEMVKKLTTLMKYWIKLYRNQFIKIILTI